MTMDAFWLALQFLTRLPTPEKINYDAKTLGSSVFFYPLVGLILGGLLVLTQFLLQDASPMLKASMLLLVWTSITGGLHLDGLADCADAWIGGQGDAKRSLEIMKDVHSGPIAITALILILLIKFAGLAEISSQIKTLLFTPMIARAGVHYFLLTTPYVRPQGLGSPLVENMPKNAIMGMLLSAVLLGFIFLGLWPMLSAIAMTWLLRRAMLKKLQGCTGDALGASIEIMEATILFVLALTNHG